LNLGAGLAPNPDERSWLRVDIDPRTRADLYADARYLPFDNNSIERIHASHILEHIPYPETENVLQEWHRVLALNGFLCLSVPDIGRLASAFLDHSSGDTFITFTLQAYAGVNGAFSNHCAAFDREYFLYCLPKLGFTEPEFLPPQTDLELRLQVRKESRLG